MEYKDYYEILGIKKTATPDEVKKAYRSLAKKYHPDLHPDDKEAQDRFKQVNEAYEVLGDEEKRKKYDMFGKNYDFQGGQNFDPNAYGFGNYTYHSTGGGESFSDFFNMFFGGGGGFDRIFNRKHQQRQKYETTLEISLREAYNGGERTVGFSIDGENKEVVIKWPKGIEDGKKIRVKGERFGVAGDIYVKISLIDKEKLQGLDISEEVTVFPWEALFGTKKTVETLGGKIKVTIPENTSGKARIRIPGRGFQNRAGKRGDLYLNVRIDNPKNMSDKQRALYERLAKEG